MTQHYAVYDADGIAPTISACDQKDPTKIEILPEMEEGDVLAMHTPGRDVKRQNESRFKNDESSFTITTSDVDGIAFIENEEIRIRYLTPRECLRLMGQDEEAIDRLMEAVPAKTVLYKLAGNSIVVDVLVAVFKGIYIDETFSKPRPKQSSLEGWL